MIQPIAVTLVYSKEFLFSGSGSRSLIFADERADAGPMAVAVAATDLRIPNTGDPGGAGAGGSPAVSDGAGAAVRGPVPDPEPPPVVDAQCRAEACESSPQGLPIEGCCAPEGECGYDTQFFGLFGVSFGQSCMPRRTGGQDLDCPDVTVAMGSDAPVKVSNLPGCCMPNGLFGALPDTANVSLMGLVALDMGCIDP